MTRFLRSFGRDWTTRLGQDGLPRSLRRIWLEQRSQEYWRRRERERYRRFRIVKLRHDLWATVEGARETVGTLRATLVSLASAAAMGIAILAVVLLAEWVVIRLAGWELVPTADSATLMSAFPVLAVQVLAAFLGFYLATVGIVLGNSYHEESASVRALVMRNQRTVLHLKLLGLAIGAGFFLVLLQSFGLYSYGYLTLGAYAILVCLSGWAFSSLAFGAFDLLNPISLASEPMRTLYQSVVQLDSGGLHKDDAVLRARAQAADRALQELAELFRLAGTRPSVSRIEMANVVERLFRAVAFYLTIKHRLLPESGWFLREPAYPRWFESDESMRSLALSTSTSLQVLNKPVPDWLEKRAAELAVAALGACVATNDTMAGIQITRAAGKTAHALGLSYRVDDGMVFVEVLREGCWSLEQVNEASNVIAAEPPLMLTNFLLGWGKAIRHWPSEVDRAMVETKWDEVGTGEVHILGSDRVWREAQRLRKEIQVEHTVEGRRVSPDWFLRSALATECIFSLREFAAEMPQLLRRFVKNTSSEKIPAQAQATAAAQSLEMLRKAEKLTEIIELAKLELEELQTGHESQPSPEIGSLAAEISSLSSPVLSQLADSLASLSPEQTTSVPDYFGQALFTLWHHSENAIARGEEDLIRGTFGKTLRASLVAHDHLTSSYGPPTYQTSLGSLNPILNLLALSGLALLYEALREDQSANSVREAWEEWLQEGDARKDQAKRLLDLLDVARGGLPIFDATRAEWAMRLARRVVDEGYAVPETPLGSGRPDWHTPRLIKVLGVSEGSPRNTLEPIDVFAGEQIAVWSGESHDELRRRIGLQRYHRIVDARGQAEWHERTDDLGPVHIDADYPCSARQHSPLPLAGGAAEG